MKKLFFLTAVFAAGMLATSCSSDKEVATGPEEDISGKFNANGEAFISFKIQTPTQGVTRADEFNDHFEAATTEESKVGAGILVVFSGSSEDEATFQGAYTLSGTDATDVANNVDKIYTATLTNEGITGGATVYAFVALNPSGVFEVQAGNGLKVTTVTGDVTVSKGSTKFSTFKKYEINKYNNTQGFLMTNAPETTSKNETTFSGTATAITLFPLAADKVKTSQTASTADPVVVYVERVIAKVGVHAATATTNNYDLGNDNPTLSETATVSFVKADVRWVSDNTEDTYYLVRNISNTYLGYKSSLLGSNYFRFLAATPELATVPSDEPTYYRTYWAEDPHYNYTSDTQNADLASATRLTATTTTWGTSDCKSLGNTDYIAENTMNQYGLTQDKTTRVVIMIPFKTGTNYEDFWTLNGVDEILNKTSVESNIKTYVKETALASWLSTYSDVVDSDWSVTVSDKTISIAQTKYTGSDAGKTAFDGIITSTYQTDLVGILNLKYYKNGKSYYQVRIRHFSDTETPLYASGGAPSGSSYADLYGATPSAENFLGRYGVVRNNWYEIELEKVRHIGSPDIPEVQKNPDDEVDQYLSTKIYVTKWAKRQQGAIL